MPASVIAEKRVERLNDYGVDMAKDVVPLICDGASVNRALARQLQKEGWTQFCVAHGIHLVVCDLRHKAEIAHGRRAGLCIAGAEGIFQR